MTNLSDSFQSLENSLEKQERQEFCLFYSNEINTCQYGSIVSNTWQANSISPSIGKYFATGYEVAHDIFRPWWDLTMSERTLS